MLTELSARSKLVTAVAVVVLGAFAGHLVLRGLIQTGSSPRWEIENADMEAGRLAIVRHGCASCHVIPGVRHARGRVGPKLEELHHQIFLAGMLPNTPENLILWLQHPDRVNPRTAMPNLGLSYEEARDIAAYLYNNP